MAGESVLFLGIGVFLFIILVIVGVYFYIKDKVLLPDGATCKESIECKSGWCTGSFLDSGMCQAVTPPGHACDDNLPDSNGQCGDGGECGAVITDASGSVTYICCPSKDGTNPAFSDKEYCTLHSGEGGFCYDDSMCTINLTCSVSTAIGDPGVCQQAS